MEALPISTYNGFYAKSDREYTKGMRKNRYFDEIDLTELYCCRQINPLRAEKSRENGR